MQQINYSGFPALLGDLEALEEELNAALKKAGMMLGCILLLCAALAIYALFSTGP